MIGIDNKKNGIALAQQTGVLQYAGKLGYSIIQKGLANAIPMAGKLAAKGGLLGTIGVNCSKFLGAAAGFMGGPLGAVVGEIVGQLVIYAATNAIAHVAKKLNLINEDDSAEEIGYRLAEANRHEDWLRAEEFQNFGEYYEYLRRQVPDDSIDRAEFANDRLYYTAIGGSALRHSVSERINMDIPVDMLIEIGRCRLDGETLKEILDRFSAANYDLRLFKDYLLGKLNTEDKAKIEGVLFDSLQAVYPEFDAEKTRNKLGELRRAASDDVFLVQSMLKDTNGTQNGEESVGDM